MHTLRKIMVVEVPPAIGFWGVAKLPPASVRADFDLGRC